MKTTNYVLITGGSSGLGKELALQCAAKGFNIILIALPGSNAYSLAKHIRIEFDIEVHVFEFDLTNKTILAEKLDFIIENFEISFLINNAGIGGTVSISESSFEALDNIIQLNIRSMTFITRRLLPHLIKHNKSYIMNISSMAAFTPIAYKTVYPASKAFVSSFSLGLREELQGSGLSVSVVYPGPIMTNSNVSGRIMKQGFMARLGLLPTQEIARIALNKTLNGHAVIIPGLWNSISYNLMKMLPLETKLKIVSREVRKEVELSF
ncbi:NADP-dependent 3-hydroxy acid dehydrogenase YdfG [compost metagenome]